MRTLFRRVMACLAVTLAAAALTVPSVQAQDTPTQAAPTAPGPAATVTKETVENPYGLEALWRQGDFVSKGTLVILVIMSMGSWYIIFVKLWEQYKLMAEGRRRTRADA